MTLNESNFEDAVIYWFGNLGDAVGHGPQLAPGKPVAVQDSLSEVALVGCLREIIQRPNPAIPEETPASASAHADRRATHKESLSVKSTSKGG